jgi:hypothetical protein
MLLLASTSDKVQIVTDAAVTVDVHASYVDYSGSTVTPGRKNTLISTATTTDVVAAPGASTTRNVKAMEIRNRHASLPVTVTVKHTDGTTVVELYSVALLPGHSLQFLEETGFFDTAGASSPALPYYGKIYAARGACDPNELLRDVQNVQGAINPTPTNIGSTVARCVFFRPPADIVVNRIRFYGVAVVSAIYTCAIYRYSDLARLSASLTLTTAAGAWGSVGSAMNLSLSAGVLYFIAVSANTTGVTAGLMSVGSTTTSTAGQINTIPGSMPGNMDFDSNFMSCMFFQFAVTAGAMPTPAATLAAPGAWTGGFPAFWLDNADV